MTLNRLFPLTLLGLTFLIGCGTDNDGDGFSPPADCNDEDAAVNPDATELAGDLIDSDCDGDPEPRGDDDDAADDDDADPGIFDSTEAVTGDFSCKGNLPDVVPGETGEMIAPVEDFEEDEPVPGAKVQVWPENNPEAGAAAATTILDEDDGTTDGQVTIPSGLINACKHFASRVWTEFEPQETYQTYQVNMAVDGDPPFTGETFNSVAFSTYNLLPLTVGVEPEPGKGIAAGTFNDCNGDPIANGEASVGNLDLTTGTVTEAAGYQMRYFTDESPDGDQMHISEDGLFGAMNVSPGDALTLMVWGIPQDEAHCDTDDGGNAIFSERNAAMCLLGSSSIVVQPDSVNISNVDLRPFPAGCYN